jgi:MoxR-like ATPase
MSDGKDAILYAGAGIPISKRNLRLPLFERLQSLDAPEYYLAEKGLRDAVNVALALGQPLLVTGDPGTGKTQLAASVAYELELPAPLTFHSKTTSTAKDLFYRYDALGHFHDSQFQKTEISIESYIVYEETARSSRARPCKPLKNPAPARDTARDSDRSS